MEEVPPAEVPASVAEAATPTTVEPITSEAGATIKTVESPVTTAEPSAEPPKPSKPVTFEEERKPSKKKKERRTGERRGHLALDAEEEFETPRYRKPKNKLIPYENMPFPNLQLRLSVKSRYLKQLLWLIWPKKCP